MSLGLVFSVVFWGFWILWVFWGLGGLGYLIRWLDLLCDAVVVGV